VFGTHAFAIGNLQPSIVHFCPSTRCRHQVDGLPPSSNLVRYGHRSSFAVELRNPDMDIGALSLSSPVTLQLPSPPIGRRTLIKYQTRPSGSSLIMATQLSTIWDPSYVNTLTAITSSYYFGTAIPEQAHPWT